MLKLTIGDTATNNVAIIDMPAGGFAISFADRAQLDRFIDLYTSNAVPRIREDSAFEWLYKADDSLQKLKPLERALKCMFDAVRGAATATSTAVVAVDNELQRFMLGELRRASAKLHQEGVKPEEKTYSSGDFTCKVASSTAGEYKAAQKMQRKNTAHKRFYYVPLEMRDTSSDRSCVWLAWPKNSEQFEWPVAAAAIGREPVSKRTRGSARTQQW